MNPFTLGALIARRAVWPALSLLMLSGIILTSGCSVQTTGGGPVARRPEPQSAPAPTRTASVDPAQVERLKRIMLPLIQAMDHPVALDQVKVGIFDDPSINAASGGGGEF